MNADNFVISWPEELQHLTEETVATTQPVETVRTPENQPNGMEIGWEGTAALVVFGALLIKTIHGPNPK